MQAGYHIRMSEYETNQPGSVVVCENSCEQLLLLTCFRYGIEKLSIEFPRGYREPNESYEEAAHRELNEETKIPINKQAPPMLVGSFYVNTAIHTGEIGVVYIKTNVEKERMLLDTEEGIEQSDWFCIEKIRSLISNGTIKDSFTINALTLYLLNNTCAR